MMTVGGQNKDTLSQDHQNGNQQNQSKGPPLPLNTMLLRLTITRPENGKSCVLILSIQNHPQNYNNIVLGGEGVDVTL